MDWRAAWWTAASLVVLGQCLLSCVRGAEQTECPQMEYMRCMRMADPLLRDPDYVFPDNRRDIGRVCSVWRHFVSCVQGYTHKCFSESRQVAFDKAVQDTKESMRQMCDVSQYQIEYLKHASCMKSMLTRDENCGKHYQHLVRQVYTDVSHSALCCSLHIFRECMIAEVQGECDQGSEGGQATRFTRHTLDKALSFLREQCYAYVPSSGECPGLGLTPTGRSEDGTRGSTYGMDRPQGPSVTPWTPRGGHRQMTTGSDTGAVYPTSRSDSPTPRAWSSTESSSGTSVGTGSSTSSSRGGDRQMTSSLDTGAVYPASRSGSSAPRPWSPTESSRDTSVSSGAEHSWTSSSRGIPSFSEGTDDFSPWYPRHTDTAAGSSHHNPSISHPESTTPLSSQDPNAYSASRASTFGRGMGWSPSTSSWSSTTGSSWTPSTSTWSPPTNSWTPPGNSWTPPSNSWTPPGNSWKSPTNPWTPSTSTRAPPSSTWGDPWTSSKSWRPPTSSSQNPWTPSPTNTWRVTSSGGGQYSTDSWYPSGSNTVDEPNQQGLTVNNGAPGRTVLGLLLASVLVVVVGMLC